jgi:hypothetical protein
VRPLDPERRSAGLAASFAEAFFAQGVRNFLCTGWPVGDTAARLFARHLYGQLLGLDVSAWPETLPDDPTQWPALARQARGPRPLYEAVRQARLAAAAAPGGLKTWGAYQHYGDPGYRFFAARRRTTTEGMEAVPAAEAAAPAAPAGPTMGAARFDRVIAVIRARGRELRSLPGVVDVRPGIRFRHGWPTGEPAVVVVVEQKRDDVPADQRLPAEIDGVPLDVAAATPLQLLRRDDPRLAERLQPEEPLLLPGEAPVIEAAADDERGALAYVPPPGVRLDEITDAMTVTCHVSPDDGWPMLDEFFGGVRRRLTVGMYDFSAPHVRDGLRDALTRSPASARRSLTLVLDPKLALTNGGDEASNPKANDVTEDKVRDALSKALHDRLDFAWAAVKLQGKTTAGIFPNAYHIKVAVRDGEAFWLSSGNWQSTNQPPPDAVPESDEDQAELRRTLKRYNREWHVVVEHAGLANVFERFLQNDLAQAAPLQDETRGVVEELRLPDLLVPELPEDPERAARPVKLFDRQPFRFTGQRKLRVQPLLTPDKDPSNAAHRVYAARVLELVRSARKKLYFQNQYINLGKRMEPAFVELVAALKDKANDRAIDTRIILRDLIGAREMLEALLANGFPADRIRLQKATHTKGIVVDGAAVLVGSHNWSSNGTTRNRDASLIFFDKRIADYYERIFLHDWDALASARVSEELAMPRLAGRRRGGGTTGLRRVPWEAYFED